MDGGSGGFLEKGDIGEEDGLFGLDMFGEILNVAVEEIPQGDQDGMLRFVVSRQQENALLYFGELFLQVIDMGPLDIIYDHIYGEAIEILRTEHFLFEFP